MKISERVKHAESFSEKGTPPQHIAIYFSNAILL